MKNLEDGEIPDSAYDPSLEWPGESSAIPGDLLILKSSSPPPKELSSVTSTLRLLVTQTTILPRKQKLIIPDGHTELQFGRDVAPVGSNTPRIRLKEMEVSKVHATVYWDEERLTWGIVDMGSKHGTFVKSFLANPEGRSSLDEHPGEDIRGMRLSLPRVASVPRRLYHLDSVTIGSTTFLVHVHEDRMSCVECAAGAACEVPLFRVSQEGAATASKRTGDVAGIDYDFPAGAPRDHKKALTMLKHSLLARHNREAPSGDSNIPKRSHYVDRSARRRALHPGSHPDAPGVRSGLPTVAFQPCQPLVTRADTLVRQPPPSSPVERSPPAPLSGTNVGHRLLMKQGWRPGKALGLPDESAGERDGLTEPIEVNVNPHRAGLGMSIQKLALSVSSLSSPLDWREDAKQRRWNGVRGRE